MKKSDNFITAAHPQLGTLWAAIDPQAHHLQPQIADRRWPAYLSPYPNETAARRALEAEGATMIEPEVRKKRGR